MSNALVKLSDDTVSKLVLNGDLSGLKPDEKVQFYKSFCERVGLDAATKPFQLIKLNGKEILYADRGCAQQLNRKHGISHRIEAREVTNDCYVVTATAYTTEGRQTTNIGAVPIAGLKGDNLANALMKAETKAKRRSTLDLVGLGCLDETEMETIPATAKAPVEVSPLKVLPSPQEQPSQAVFNPPPTPKAAEVSAAAPSNPNVKTIASIRDGSKPGLKILSFTDNPTQSIFTKRKMEAVKVGDSILVNLKESVKDGKTWIWLEDWQPPLSEAFNPRLAFFEAVAGMELAAQKYMRETGVILMDELLVNIDDKFLPATQRELDTVVKEIKIINDADELPM